MAIANATTIRRRARAVPQQRLAERIGTSRGRIVRTLRAVDDLAAVLAALGLEVVEAP